MDKIYYISQIDRKMYNIKDCAHLAYGKNNNCFGKHIFHKYGARMEATGSLMTLQEVADAKEVNDSEKIYFISQFDNQIHNIKDWEHRLASPDEAYIGKESQSDGFRVDEEVDLYSLMQILEFTKK